MNKMVVCFAPLSFLRDGMHPPPVPSLFLRLQPQQPASVHLPPPSFSSSNNLKDTGAILVWVYARNLCQYYTCTPKTKSSTCTFNVHFAVMWRHSLHLCKCIWICTRICICVWIHESIELNSLGGCSWQ